MIDKYKFYLKSLRTTALDKETFWHEANEVWFWSDSRWLIHKQCSLFCEKSWGTQDLKSRWGTSWIIRFCCYWSDTVWHITFLKSLQIMFICQFNLASNWSLNLKSKNKNIVIKSANDSKKWSETFCLQHTHTELLCVYICVQTLFSNFYYKLNNSYLLKYYADMQYYFQTRCTVGYTL